MRFTSNLEQNVLVVSFTESLIREDNPVELFSLVEDFLSKGVTLCAVDLSQLAFINSAGLGIIITLLTKFRNKGGELVVINPSEHVKKLLIITKLNAIFHIEESEEAAVQFLNGINSSQKKL